MNTFEKFLQDRFTEEVDCTENAPLDDDWPDAFDAWLADMDSDKLMFYGEQYGKVRYLQGVVDGGQTVSAAVDRAFKAVKI
jgi:hypothetical protein